MESVQNLDQTQRAGAAAVGGLVLATAAQLLMGRKVNLLATAAFTAVAGMAGCAIKGQLGGGTIDVKRVKQLRRQLSDRRFEWRTLSLKLAELLEANGGKFDTADLKWLRDEMDYLPSDFEGEDNKALREAFVKAALDNPMVDKSMLWIRFLWQDATKHITDSNAAAEVPKVMPMLAAHVKTPKHVAALLASFAGLDLDGVFGAVLTDLMRELKKGENEQALTYEHLKPFIKNDEIGFQSMMTVVAYADPTNIEDIARAMTKDNDGI